MHLIKFYLPVIFFSPHNLMSCQILAFPSLVVGVNYSFRLHGAATGGIHQDGGWVEVLSPCTRYSLCTELYL